MNVAHLSLPTIILIHDFDFSPPSQPPQLPPPSPPIIRPVPSPPPLLAIAIKMETFHLHHHKNTHNTTTPTTTTTAITIVIAPIAAFVIHNEFPSTVAMTTIAATNALQLIPY